MASTTFHFQDKVVVVTGGNSGIGLATVNEFTKAGAKVAVLDIRPPADLPATDGNGNRLDVTCDVGSEASAEAAIAEVLRKWGTIDILCNVAGIMDAMDRVSETETAVWERCFRVNVTGPFYLIRACTKHFLTKPKTDPVTPRGQIVNVCSTASKTAAHAGAAYTSSKHAMLGLSRSTAWMYAKEGIRCNAVLPGGVMTNIMANSGIEYESLKTSQGMGALWPVNQLMPAMAQASDVAKTILFTAANESINGAEISVDQGWTTI